MISFIQFYVKWLKINLILTNWNLEYVRFFIYFCYSFIIDFCFKRRSVYLRQFGTEILKLNCGSISKFNQKLSSPNPLSINDKKLDRLSEYSDEIIYECSFILIPLLQGQNAGETLAIYI